MARVGIQRAGTLGVGIPTRSSWSRIPQLPAPTPRNTGKGPAWSSQRSRAEPADATDIIRGLIRELSDLNRLAMGARRGLELLRRPRPRQGRRSRWKEP
ncbi:uncharacterized protein C19orf57 homolog [Empidonax traillii]|uniref:uncharacterized protein C19orf57 homolog n=1 Tax=Empidonax traillii TaxID=164674 RepID=UPI000FFD4081|nr:uncharacterized protein C19orf57 homolog [Empidonax traillii]